MSEAGTLLSDLDGARPTDGDLVDSILSDLNNSGGGGNPVVSQAPPPPMGNRMPMQRAPPPPQVYPNGSDPAVATAHMIGGDSPTPADFQRMMMAAQGPLPFNAMIPQMQQPIMQGPPPQAIPQPQKNWQGQWIDELKQPVFVAILFFLITLPAVNVLFSHYAPTLLAPGGGFTTMGNLVRAGAAGGLFWVSQRILAPLLSA